MTDGDDASAKDMEVEGDTELLERITERFVEGEFSAVLPDEQNQCADAAEVLALCEDEAAACTAHIDMKYKLYRETLGEETSTPEAETQGGMGARVLLHTSERTLSEQSKKTVTRNGQSLRSMWT